MSFISDEKLFSHNERVKGKVVIITGAANGIGKETALRFGQYGAKVVIGDVNLAGAQETVFAIKAKGGSALALRCDVTKWDDQVALFELAEKEFGAVDVVVPNAGVSEMGGFHIPKLNEAGKPARPTNMKTLDVNLTGALYTIQLALHYLHAPAKAEPGTLKAIILIGSMASWMSIPGGALYTASKHAMLGVMRSLSGTLPSSVRIGCIHPFFADTSILSIPVKLFLAGIPLTKVERVAGAIFYAATDPDASTNGSSWLLADDGEVFCVPKEEFKFGVYGMLDQRVNSIKNAAKGVGWWITYIRDVNRILGRPLLKAGIPVVAASVAWCYRSSIQSVIVSALQWYKQKGVDKRLP
ncbi:hypothetical protein CPB83DRAFT_856337 [Crepidotus variabilis]|uniref:NAD(P)-binding protein n=1 Tax=Crepidotus variabilis TaxID=179855 RepID=A0A9P6JNE6_9AGAR|nr:hypothetical protein CPB83DRAFT_856337 [Crepidotus variabilis]